MIKSVLGNIKSVLLITFQPAAADHRQVSDNDQRHKNDKKIVLGYQALLYIAAVL